MKKMAAYSAAIFSGSELNFLFCDSLESPGAQIEIDYRGGDGADEKVAESRQIFREKQLPNPEKGSINQDDNKKISKNSILASFRM